MLVDIDFTGQRIYAYKIIYYLVQQLNNMRKCVSRYVANEDRIFFVQHAPDDMKSDRIKRLIKYVHRIKPALLKAKILNRFQYNNTVLWNKHTDKVAKLIIPPISLDNEIKTGGYGMALIELLV